MGKALPVFSTFFRLFWFLRQGLTMQLASPGLLGVHSIKLRDPPASAFQVPRSKVCDTTPYTSLLFYVPEDYLPGDGTTHSGLGPSNKKCPVDQYDGAIFFN